MDADLDTLATALDARTDDLLKSFPEHVPWKIQTKGDANRTAGAWDLRPDQVKGVLFMRLLHLGDLMFLRQPTGIASVMTLGLAVWLLWGFSTSPM